MRPEIVASLSEIVLAAGFDPERWGSVPAAICQAFPGTKASLIGQDRRSRHCIGAYSYGFSDDLVSAYVEHFAAINPWADYWQRAEPMRAVASELVAPASGFVETEFYQDWLKPVGDIECGAGLKIVDQPDVMAMVTVNYGRAAAERYDRDLPRLLQMLAPSFRAAIALNRRLGETDPGNRSLDHVLEAMDCAAVVVAGGKPLVANSRAAAMIDATGPLRQGPDGRLRLADPAATFRLSQSLARIARGGGAGSESFRLAAVGATPALKITVVSLGPAAPATLVPPWLGRQAALALVTIRAEAVVPPAPDADFATDFGLTPSEARVTARLVAGGDPGRIALDLGIARETVRTHLKRIYDKTGCRRQAELVALLMRRSSV